MRPRRSPRVDSDCRRNERSRSTSPVTEAISSRADDARDDCVVSSVRFSASAASSVASCAASSLSTACAAATASFDARCSACAATMRPLYSPRFAVESSSETSLCRRAFPACRFSEFKLRVTSASVSSMRNRFACVSSSFISAARRFVLYFVMPAASSISRRRSCGLLDRIRSIFPCSMTE